MYKPEGLALEIFKSRYAINPEETWEKACWRLSKSIASVELPEKRTYWEDRFFGVLSNNKFMPGGRIWNGAAKPKGGLLNCFVIEPKDSREGWAKASSDMIVISSLGGGVGMNLSNIRPKGSPIKGTGGYSSGPLALMQLINDNGTSISTGGGRRVALMQCLNIDHPDINEFINSKTFKCSKNQLELVEYINNYFPNLKTDNKFQHNILKFANTEYGLDTLFAFCKALNDTKFNKANISVVIPKHIQEENIPEDLYNLIIENAYESGDPGILNFRRAEEDNNIAYLAPISSTNPCGEIPMTENEVCCLGSIVLSRIKPEDYKEDLYKTINTSIRFLDNVLDITQYPNKEIESNAKNLRRIGLGVLGYHDLLLKRGVSYSSQGSSTFKTLTEDIAQDISLYSYRSSIEIAKEKGPFPGYSNLFWENGFAKKVLDWGWFNSKQPIRNCATLSIAPTGTISMVCDTSSGIEPIFSKAYKRRYYEGDKVKMEVVYNKLYQQFLNDKKPTNHFEDSSEISLENQLSVQAIWQKYFDQGISKTLNIPNDYPIDSLKSAIKEYLPKLKGITIYRAGSKGGEPLENISCPSGICEL